MSSPPRPPSALTRSTDAATYLRKYLPPHPNPEWTTVLETLTPPTPPASTPLTTVVATPLGLWLLRAMHLETRRSPLPLTDTTTFPPPHRCGPSARQPHPPLSSRPARPNRVGVVTSPTIDSIPPTCGPDPVLTTIAGHLRDTGKRRDADARDRDWCWWRVAHYSFPAGTELALRITRGLVIGMVA